MRTAIVVEGGAMRGVFSAGVLDVLHEHGIDFDLAIGTSAGAANLASFVARQHQRNLRAYVDLMSRPELFSLGRALRGGHYMDLDWLWERLATELPLDEPAIARSRSLLVSAATCANTGDALYFEHRGPNVHEEVKGGCAVPILYRGPVMVRGQSVVDGGLSDPIPAAEAYRRGARRIVVVRSRPAHVVKDKSALDPLMGLMLREQPAVARAARAAAARYHEAVAYLASPPPDANVIQLAPEQPLKTGRTSQDRATLRADYALGRRIAERELSNIEALRAR